MLNNKNPSKFKLFLSLLVVWPLLLSKQLLGSTIQFDTPNDDDGLSVKELVDGKGKLVQLRNGVIVAEELVDSVMTSIKAEPITYFYYLKDNCRNPDVLDANDAEKDEFPAEIRQQFCQIVDAALEIDGDEVKIRNPRKNSMYVS